jgi:hypothetical protein
MQDTGNWCCEDCTDNVEFCDECDEYYENGCNSCGSTIHSYQYKPDPIFYGTDTNKMYLGLELETEIRTNSVACRESAELITNQVPEIYLKSDSSISGQGYEIVSHPLSFNYWQDNMQHFYDTLEELRTTYNARSWDSDSCGIHIHISRNGFKSGAHMHRWINFIYKNVEDVTKYAGRGNNRYAQYGDVYKHDKYGRPYFTLKDKITNGGFTERYSAVNTQNQNTLELRVFRGTTNSNGVRATLEFAHASVEYTRDMSISDVKLGMLGWDWFKDYVQVNNGIYPNLYSRLDKCKSANLNKRELIEA